MVRHAPSPARLPARQEADYLADKDRHSLSENGISMDFYRTEGMTHSPLYGTNGNVWFAVGSSVGEFILQTKTIKQCSGTTGASQGIAIDARGQLWFGISGVDLLGSSTMNCNVKTYPTAGWTGGVVIGPDENIYFTDMARKIGKATPDGKITEYPTSGSTTSPIVGPNGNIYFGEIGSTKVGMLNITNGKVTEWDVKAISQSGSLLARPDGSVWFGTDLAIGQITPAGKVEMYTIPENAGAAYLMDGPDGNVWFACQYASKVGQVTSKGKVSTVDISGLPMGMTFGKDNKLYVGQTSYALAIVSIKGIAEERQLTGAVPYAPHLGPDDNIWFSGNPWQSPGVSPFIGRITPQGDLHEFKTSAYPNSFLNARDGQSIYLGMNTFRFGVINL